MTVDLGAWALLGVAAGSAAAAVLALLVLRRWSDQDAIARAKAQAQAHLLEFRLFMDDPVAIMRSQRALLIDNVRLFGLLLKPLLLMSAPMLLLLWQMDALYSRAPLRTGAPAVVTLATAGDSVEAPSAVAVEAGPVHIRATGETCWRIRPRGPVSGSVNAASASTKLVAGDGIAYLPRPFIGASVLEIAYPRATVLGFHWLIWFMLLSTVAAFALRRPLGVVF